MRSELLAPVRAGPQIGAFPPLGRILMAQADSGRAVLVLSRREVTRLLDIRACIDAVEEAFRMHAARTTIPAGVLGVHVPGGGFHVKTAGLLGEARVFVMKVNANFPGNPSRHGLPTIQGVVVLFDLEAGRPLAILDSMAITGLRTAAATAVAAKHLARADAGIVTICGCGEQASHQLRALAAVRPLRRALACDADADRALRFAGQMAHELGIEVAAASDLATAARESDLIVTNTPARRWILGSRDVPAGAFVAAVGADHPEKQELEPALLAANTVVVDSLEQCAVMGDLHHALEAGVMSREDVHAELADVVAGTRPGRRTADEIIIFDSTGTALQDAAAASAVYSRAIEAGSGRWVDLDGG
jgi:ornithine cyclodeaminase/alanine dehydrogenase-like protein (mu-crystallin family)